MVLEEIFSSDWVRHRPYLAFVFGFLFTFIAFFLSMLFFKGAVSVAMVFLTTLLLMPTLIMLLRMEERIERKDGTRHFFANHKDIFEVYLFSFLGVFLAFVVLGLGMYPSPEKYGQLFQFQNDFLKFQEGLSSETVTGFVQGNFEMGGTQVISLFTHDLLVLLICFVLSFFYGATAVFLIILNGSVFANFIVFVIRTLASNAAQGVQAFIFFLIHMIPEVSGFLAAAIAGGVVSKAFIYEKRGTKGFRNVFKDATFLMLIAVSLVLVGVVLEVFVTARLFKVFF
jgi:uncharacterized membrane protein SpoIIM required for sporulation